jgi:cob(I)alamin adenosyltransferase
VKIYTKTGDEGETGLFGGGRVPKDALRVTAYGEVDELNAVLGVALATKPERFERALLLSVQRDLFAIGAQLASPDAAKVAGALAKASITEARIAELERKIDSSEKGLKPLKAFILPGGAPKAAILHLARTVCRRAERGAVAVAHAEAVPSIIVKYLNRLGDLLFVLARAANKQARKAETEW